MDVKLEQQRRLRDTIGWARKIKEHLAVISEANGHRVHFRPGSTGVSMVGLHHDLPQRGRSGIQDLARLARDFDAEFATHCSEIKQGRPTGEKALQSFLIRDAYSHGRDLHAINVASAATDEPVRLVFVTDEISLQVDGGKMVCDVLALRRDGGRCTPVLLELKDNRALTRLVEQVTEYAALIDEHAGLYGELYGVLLGEAVRFDAPTERWIVWPQAGEPADPREVELATKSIRVVGYTNQVKDYAFRVGQGVRQQAASTPMIVSLEGVEIADTIATAEHEDEPSNRSLPGNRTNFASAAPLIDVEQRFAGCLLGGAVGDALGGAIEFMSLAAIRNMFGPHGIADLAPAYGRVGAVTDDTQMTLFTAEGLIRAASAARATGGARTASVVHHAYLRWLLTQGVQPYAQICVNTDGSPWPDGWLIQQKELWHLRAPGRTCLTALHGSTALGQHANNDSKGCGTVMRVAPVGLLLSGELKGGTSPAFDMGCEVSRLTHGHPSGYLAGGYFAQLIALLREGQDLVGAVNAARLPLEQQGAPAQEVLDAIDAAVELARMPGEPTAERLATLGQGWVAEEALSIALYCALVARDFEHGVTLAVNHSGDSDSTGSMAGNVLGLIHGPSAIPSRWLQHLELTEVITELAHDMATMSDASCDSDPLRIKYPGW